MKAGSARFCQIWGNDNAMRRRRSGKISPLSNMNMWNVKISTRSGSTRDCTHLDLRRVFGWGKPKKTFVARSPFTYCARDSYLTLVVVDQRSHRPTLSSCSRNARSPSRAPMGAGSEAASAAIRSEGPLSIRRRMSDRGFCFPYFSLIPLLQVLNLRGEHFKDWQ